MPVCIGVAALLVVGIGFGVVVALSGGDEDDSVNDASTAQDSGSPNSTSASSNANIANNSPSNAVTDPSALAPRPASNPLTQTRPPMPVPVVARPPRFWVQLSNLKVKRIVPVGIEITLDYRVVSGQPETGATYSIAYDIPQGMGVVNRVEVNVDDFKKTEGTLTRQHRDTGFAGPGGYAYAIQDDHDMGIPISGELRPGSAPTSNIPPKSPAEIVGAAATGKLVALANAEVGRGINGTYYSLEYEMLGKLQPGKRYYLIVKEVGNSRAVKGDFTKELQNARIGVLGVTPTGIVPSGSLEFYIATDVGYAIGGDTVVSNVLRTELSTVSDRFRPSLQSRKRA